MELKKYDLLDLNKGEIRKGQSLFAWDAVQDCHTGCKIFSRCKYNSRASNKRDTKCEAQLDYLQVLMETIASSYRYLDALALFQIGMEIIPLYSNLFRLKLVEVGLVDIVTETRKGPQIHPVYKEIRQTLFAIHLAWRSLSLSPSIMEPAFEDSPQGVRLLRGDPDYQENLAASAGDRKGIVR